MRLHTGWMTGAVIAAVVLNGAAFADVTVSHSNDPTADIGGQMAMLFGAERQALDGLPEGKLGEVAVGPQTSAPAAPKDTDPTLVRYDDAWLAAQPEPTGDAQWECLRQAIYFEARGESLKGQFAVGEVILNRVESGHYPKTICKVVNQRGHGSCQFSYACDGKTENMTESAARDRAGRIARVLMDGAPRTLTMGATHFHTRGVRPDWSSRFDRTAQIGAHLFYRQP